MFRTTRYAGNGWNCGDSLQDQRITIAQGRGIEGGELLSDNYRIGFTDTGELTNLGAFDSDEGVEPTEAGSDDRLLRGLVVDNRGHGIFSYSGSSGGA